MQWWPVWLLVVCTLIVLSWVLWRRIGAKIASINQGFLYALSYWAEHAFQDILSVPRLWCITLWRRLKSGEGYVLLFTIVSAYGALYTIQTARYELLFNRATFERSTFITMVSSGNRGSFIAAMKDFGRIQNMEVPIEPHLLKPWSWFLSKHRPNKIPLYLWAKFFLALCTPEICGEPSKEMKSERINLFQADLREAFFGTDPSSLIESLRYDFRFEEATIRLQEALEDSDSSKNTGVFKIPYKEYQHSVDLHKADLRFANLSKSYMYDVNLYGADLRGANLAYANLSGADLVKADLRFAELKGTKLRQTYLHGADLRKAKGLTQTQLEEACIDKTTKLPSGFARPQSSELCELADMAVRIKYQYGSKPELRFSSPADASLP